MIPRSRGGRRKDVRIIVPACSGCNHNRGCQELIPFLLARPHRISCFLDYLGGLSPECIREIDLRIFAELYAATAILRECSREGARWRDELERRGGGRTLHRRRYAARRAVGALSERAERLRAAGGVTAGPTCVVPRYTDGVVPLHLDEPLERMRCRLLSCLALIWHLSAEVVERELARELRGNPVEPAPVDGAESDGDAEAGTEGEIEGVVALDGWKPRPKRRRVRVDRRNGRKVPRNGARGRAA